MVAPTAGLLRPRRSRHLLDAFVVLHLVAVVEEVLGSNASRGLLAEAEIDRASAPGELISEIKAARLHQALRHLHAQDSEAILMEAGRRSASEAMARDFTSRARTLLSSSPWPLAAWLVGRTLSQHAWVFSGTGTFRTEKTLDFEIVNNPLVRGERALRPACHWNRSYIGHLFRATVHPQLECFETACCATGAEACRFELRLRPGGTMPFQGVT